MHELNREAIIVYSRVSGQWNYHPVSGQAISLKTSEITAELSALLVPRERWARLLDEVRELSGLILKHWERERERLKEQNG